MTSLRLPPFGSLRPRRNPLRPVAVVAMLALMLVADGASAALLYSVGPAEVIYTASQRRSKGLNFWPDGSMGVVPLGNGQYDFYAANSTSPVRTTGTLADPGKGKKSVKINGLPGGAFNYVAGGPIYHDAATGRRLMLYHAERHAGSSRNYYSVLGMAVSTDAAGLQFQDLGLVVTPNISMAEMPHPIEVGGGSLAVLDDHLHIYYRDYLSGGGSSELAVARAPLSSVLSNALSFSGTQFTKYYNGGWTEPALGGRSSPLEVGNPANGWSAVSYNDYLDGLVMVSSQWSTIGGDLYMSTSSDGVKWSPRQPIAVDSGEQMYPSLIGMGSDPSKTGRSFYAYYTDSAKGAWDRWNDAQLVRRQITFDPAPPPPPPPPVQSPNWKSVASFRGDYKEWGPAPGWKYAWSAKGKLGKASDYAPLWWSPTAGVYNTTGLATQVYNGKSHNDDYLMLGDGWGHPGRSKYFTIAGYTIQPEDGDGLYRLVNSTIAKDAVQTKGEDGLDLWVYLNNTKLGPMQSVSVGGSLTSFNRDLGQLRVGDTVYVAIGSAKNQNYDLFMDFDFSIERYLAGPSSPPPVPPPPGPPAQQLVWGSIAGFRSDYKPWGPAPGWKYAWSAKGKLGKASDYAPLWWSPTAGVYNTTGLATQVYNGKSHNDDYLMLGDGWGHPGRSKYFTIAGYTIQPEDGDGIYRLVNSSIMKDAVKTKGEDGLDLWVYINDSKLGSLQPVSVDGALATFNRDLGQLRVGDTVYVMIGSAKNQNYDLFTNFDFKIEKLMPAPAATQSFASSQAVPEPCSAALLSLAALVFGRVRLRPLGRPRHSVAVGQVPLQKTNLAEYPGGSGR